MTPVPPRRHEIQAHRRAVQCRMFLQLGRLVERAPVRDGKCEGKKSKFGEIELELIGHYG